ncbi:amidohydrolase family protein [Falsihalocynthiibacter sp. SS001]|uniref:amidohydrolase family protein n=1 Tax=Falsihalocynthiibacter sp. SS001 TaxID=3349698 RepID=UPI0036D41919
MKIIPLIDTHAHLLRPDVAGHEWTRSIPCLAGRRFGLSDYFAAAEAQGIKATLLMEGGADEADWPAETHSLNEIAANNGQIAGAIVGGRPENYSKFAEWMEQMPLSVVRGVRRPLHVCDDDLSRGDDFRRSMSLLGEAGLTFDICVTATQLPVATELARACPDTVFILDHAGHPDIAGGNLDDWRSGISELSGCSNVVGKISGLMPLCTPGQASLAALRPCLDHMLHSFGPDRLVWGGDWPLVNMANGLADWVSVTRSFLAELSADEAELIGWQTAAQTYRLT